MSGSTPQTKAASEQSTYAAQLSQNLSALTTPQIQKLIGEGGDITKLLDSTGNGQLKSSADEKAYNDSAVMLDTAYGQARHSTNEAISYNALRSGEGRRSSGLTDSAMGRAAITLDRDRNAALEKLKFNSASSSMANYNNLLQIFGQGTNTALGIGSGAMGNANAAIGGLSNTSQASGIWGGAASGAALGTAISPGWGTAIGAVGGGIIGALGSP